VAAVRSPVSLAAVALVAAALGGGGALVGARAAGWIGPRRTETVVVSSPLTPLPTPAAVQAPILPLTSGRFDAAAIFAKRSQGVVTIYAIAPAGDQSTQGSGFVVSADGLILTNSHVITNAAQTAGGPPRAAGALYVEFSDFDRVPAKIVGWDVFDDVGLIRVDPRAHALHPVPLGSSASVQVGDPVAVIGSPFGNENSLAVGVVAATRRSIDSLTSRYNLLDAIQTDAPLNHGNSGGPMFDAAGRVIGISAQINSTSGTAEGVGFAVPIDSARRSLKQLLMDGRVHYAYVGIQSESLVPSVARRFHFAVQRGAIISGIRDKSPAQSADFRSSTREQEFNGKPVSTNGDVIVAINGFPVRSADDVVRIVSERMLPGQLARFTIVRGTTRKTISVRLSERSLRSQ
jgi:S1-C subfamily serine protease